MKGLNTVEAEFAKLERAADEFKEALRVFGKTFNPERTGIVEFQEHVDSVLYDIREEIEDELY